MPWKMIWEPDSDGRTEKDIYDELRASNQFFPPTTVDMMPIDFLKRCHWADANEAHANGCIIFFYENGEDPRKMVTGASYPTYKGMPGKRAVMVPIFQAEDRMQELLARTIRATCGQRFCVNRRHLKVAGFIKNQHV